MIVDLTAGQILFAAVVVFFCSMLQSTVGFAFALFALPCLLAANIPLPQAVSLLIVPGSVQALWAAQHMRRSIDWRLLWPITLTSMVATPFGIAVMRELSQQTGEQVRAVIGALILLSVLVRTCVRPEPRAQLSRAWDVLAGAVSGLMGGLAGIGGPPLILWVYAHCWPAEKYRVTPVAIVLPRVPFQILLMVLTFGPAILPVFGFSFVFVPLSMAGAVLGLRLGPRLPIPVLRAAAFAILAIIGVMCLVRPLLA